MAKKLVAKKIDKRKTSSTRFFLENYSSDLIVPEYFSYIEGQNGSWVAVSHASCYTLSDARREIKKHKVQYPVNVVSREYRIRRIIEKISVEVIWS